MLSFTYYDRRAFVCFFDMNSCIIYQWFAAHRSFSFTVYMIRIVHLQTRLLFGKFSELGKQRPTYFMSALPFYYILLWMCFEISVSNGINLASNLSSIHLETKREYNFIMKLEERDSNLKSIIHEASFLIITAAHLLCSDSALEEDNLKAFALSKGLSFWQTCIHNIREKYVSLKRISVSSLR